MSAGHVHSPKDCGLSPTQTLRDIDNIDNIDNRDVYFHQLCHLEIAVLMRREE